MPAASVQRYQMSRFYIPSIFDKLVEVYRNQLDWIKISSRLYTMINEPSPDVTKAFARHYRSVVHRQSLEIVLDFNKIGRSFICVEAVIWFKEPPISTISI